MDILSTQNISSIFSVLLSGLVAGLLYGYACSVNPGLGRLNDMEYLKAMQSINKAILNPVFFLSFFGSLLVLPMATWVTYNADPSIRFYFLMAATILYCIGVFGVTVAGNVPLNENLANFSIEGASPEKLLAHREKFESRWNQYHVVRTAASILCFLMTILSLLKVK